MQQPIRLLNAENIGSITADFHSELSIVGKSIVGLTGLPLLIAVKRNRLGHGPYPDVTLFEAANRIMSDLVILHGVAHLLNHKTFPFTEYKVEFGNENRNGFDIRAESNGLTLVGEAFNVAPSFFQEKKRAAMKKLLNNTAYENYRIIMFNSDALPKNYTRRPEPRVQQFVIDIPAAVSASRA